MKRRYYLIILFCFSLFTSSAQIGGESTYQFLELTNSARVAALGGNQVAIYDSVDLNLPYHNPALLHSKMSNRVLVNYVNYLTDINYGYASYAKSYEGVGNFALGMHYINYGEFDEATEYGELTGLTFNAAEYALNIIYSNSYKRLQYGASLKPILSSFESYQSFGIAADLGVNFISKDSLTSVALVAANMGSQLTTYYDNGEYEKIPFNLQVGVSRKLKHAPVIFSLTMQNLSNWKLAQPEPDPNDNEELTVFQYEESFGKQIMRHTVLGVEILPSQNFILRAGYNYQRRQELKFDDRVSTVGFSFGFGVRVKRFSLDYANSRFHLAGSSNLFSLGINLNENY
jgi:hypothetical protein